MERSELAVAAFTKSLREPDTSHVSPERLATALGAAVVDLAELAGIHHDLFEDPVSKQLQHRLREMVEVISTAAVLADDLSKAIAWYRIKPIADYRGRTAAELVDEGHTLNPGHFSMKIPGQLSTEINTRGSG